MQVLAIANQKGGVGKSSLAVNLAVELTLSNQSILLVDADPQASAAQFAAARDEDRPSFATVQLAKPILHREIPKIGQSYDVVLIDVGGRDSPTLRSALVAADSILIPLGPSAADLWASQDVFSLLDEIRVARTFKAWTLFTRMVAGTVVAREALEELMALAEEHGFSHLESVLHSRVAWPRAFGEGLSVSELEPNGSAAQELRSLCRETALLGSSS